VGSNPTLSAIRIHRQIKNTRQIAIAGNEPSQPVEVGDLPQPWTSKNMLFSRLSTAPATARCLGIKFPSENYMGKKQLPLSF